MANNYQKVYMNQIHSSTLLCELATMWKTQMLCDAIIRTGSVVTKAHRVVLVAACPMLQSMENAATGSHLEVRLAADIKQEAVNSFLQYLYEGVMILTEENCKDVEKVARLLQVESVTKCCADFYKCVLNKAGAPVPQQYKYSFHDHIEYKHVRTTGLQKMSQERQMKRTNEFSRPGSPGNKRARGNPDEHSDISVMDADRLDDSSHSYGSGDIWDRVPRLGSGMSRGNKSGGVEHVEESLELVQHDPAEKEGQSSQILTPQQKMGVSIAVASQFNTEPDVSVVNITSNKDPSRGSVDSVVADDSGGHLSSMNRHQNFSSQQDYSYHLDQQQHVPQQDYYRQNTELSFKQQSPVPLKQPGHHMQSSQLKSFAMGSASQSTSMSSSPSLSPSSVRRRVTPVSISGPGMSNVSSTQNTGFDDTLGGQSSLRTDDSNSGDIDLSIVKVESGPLPASSSSGIVTDTGGLDMHVDTDDGGISLNQQNVVLEEGEELSDTELEDWAKEDMSNEGSNVSGDQSWAQAYKDTVPFSPKISNVQRVNDEIEDEPDFSDIPLPYRLNIKQLIEINKASKSAGNFARNIVECLFPELFDSNLLRLHYSYYGGGVKSKKPLDGIRKKYLFRYVLLFYPDLRDDNLWKNIIVTSINECLRRPPPKSKYKLK